MVTASGREKAGVEEENKKQERGWNIDQRKKNSQRPQPFHYPPKKTDMNT